VGRMRPLQSCHVIHSLSNTASVGKRGSRTPGPVILPVSGSTGLTVVTVVFPGVVGLGVVPGVAFSRSWSGVLLQDIMDHAHICNDDALCPRN
jgi:hypothetical protein